MFLFIGPVQVHPTASERFLVILHHFCSNKTSSVKPLLEMSDSWLNQRKQSRRRAAGVSSSQAAAVLRVVRAFKTRQRFCAGNMGV